MCPSVAARATRRSKRPCLDKLNKNATAKAMVEKIMIGDLSGTAAHGVMQSSASDGFNNEAMEAFKSLGSNGAHPGNIVRDLHRWLKDAFGVELQPHTLQVPLRVGPGGASVNVGVPILAPHELLAATHAAGPPNFIHSLLGPDGKDGVMSFWHHAQSVEWLRGHPALEEGDPSKLIPLVTHVDGAEIYQNSEYVLWSMQALLSQGSAYDVKFPLVLLRHFHIRGKRASELADIEICKFLAWSFSWCQRGLGPPCGHDGGEFKPNTYSHALRGQELAGGWRACMVGQKSDAKARKETNRFKQNYHCEQMCDCCDAVQWKSWRTDLTQTYRDFTEHAAHRATAFGHAEYMQRVTPLTVSPWNLVPGWRKEMAFFDLMHVDALGTAGDLAASVIIDCLGRGELRGRSPEEALAFLQEDFRAWCRCRGISAYNRALTLATLGRDGSFGMYVCVSKQASDRSGSAGLSAGCRNGGSLLECSTPP